MPPTLTQAARILVLHVPRWEADVREIMVMPLGLPAIANLLAARGHHVSMVHLGLERQASRSFSLRGLVRQVQPSLVLISLHWYPQVRDVLRVAKAIHAWFPTCRIVLGGLTATWFARELIEQVSSIDGVVRGDGEQPALDLAELVARGEDDWSSVPNLVWRGADGHVTKNQLCFQLDEDLGGKLRHGDLGLLRRRQMYMQQALYADFSEGGLQAGGYAGAAYLNAGRGCSVSCANCGGAASAQLTLSGRRGVLLYPHDKLMRDVRDAYDQGARLLRTSFDPPPGRRHVRHWFRRIREAEIDMGLIYDSWYLPSRGLLEDISASFRDPVVVFSPECGSERVRFQVRGLPFRNEQLLRAIDVAEELGVRTHCFFSAGLPGEEREDIEQTTALIRQVRAQTDAEISVCPMVADPASPVFVNPERWGVTLTRKSLHDFYNQPGANWGPGYRTKSFSEKQILEACDTLLGVAGLPPAYANSVERLPDETQE